MTEARGATPAADLREHLAVALDLDDLVAALRVAREVRPWFGVAKVGLELFIASGPEAIGALAYHDFYVHSPHDEFVAEHESLIEDIAAGDPARARRAMIEHIAWGLERNVRGRAAKRRAAGAGPRPRARRRTPCRRARRGP